MRFTVSSSTLRDAITQVRPAIPTNPSYVAYSGVQLIADAHTLVLTGSDGESTLTARCAAEVDEPGSALLLPKPLLAFLATLNGSESLAAATDEQGNLTLTRHASAPYSFRPLSATYPTPPSANGTAVPCDFGRLSGAVAAVRAAVSKDTYAVQVATTDDGLTLCTTDTYRLAWARLPEVQLPKTTCVLSLTTLDRASKAAPDAATIDTKGRLVSFSSPSLVTSSRMLAVPFPAVEGIIAAPPPSGAAVSPEDLRNAIARLSAVADQAPVKMSVERDTVTLSASTADLGSGVETIPCSGGPDAPFEVLLRAPYLQEAATAFSTETVQLRFSGSLQPLFLTADEPFPLVHVVMPVRA